MRSFFWVVLLAGCPPPARYVVADVTVLRAPVHGALVAADCGAERAARRTDEDGRARVRVGPSNRACSLVIAKPGLPTVVTGPVNTCPTATACTPAQVELAPASQATPCARSAMEVAR